MDYDEKLAASIQRAHDTAIKNGNCVFTAVGKVLPKGTSEPLDGRMYVPYPEGNLDYISNFADAFCPSCTKDVCDAGKEKD